LPGDGAVLAPAGTTPAAAAGWRDQVRIGLVNLGWQAREADLAIAAVEPGLAGPDGDSAQEVDVAVALRAALRVLGRS
jgi:Holliday junction DNA helicase RuvA